MKTGRNVLLAAMVMLFSSALSFGQPAFPLPGSHPSPNNGRDFVPSSQPQPIVLPPGETIPAHPSPNNGRDFVAAPDPKAKLAAAIRQGGPAFTATVEQADMMSASMTTGSAVHVPSTVAMQVVLKDLTMLKGDKPGALRFNYSAVEGKDLFPQAGQKVIVVCSAPPPAPAVEPAPVQGPHPMLKPRVPSVLSQLPRILAIAEATNENLAAAKAVIDNPTTQPESAKTQPEKPATGA